MVLGTLLRISNDNDAKMLLHFNSVNYHCLVTISFTPKGEILQHATPYTNEIPAKSYGELDNNGGYHAAAMDK